ncbi:hypothetical protein [Rhodospirillum sp. A1_3_36]|uniref:hypothetical protein n=1 Tax=Rhodospirillum sp. A1_3_36 TaxID=3391666 RepID=UPI0039A5799F
MLQVNGLGSTIRDVLASGAGRGGVAGSSASAPLPAGQASSPDATQVAAVRRAADGTLAFQQAVGEPLQGGRSRGIERTKSRGPGIESRGDTDASENSQATAESSAPPSHQTVSAGEGGTKGVNALGGKGRATAFQAQRIAQEVTPEALTGSAEAEGSGAVQGISALARRVVSQLYDFVRDAVGRPSSQKGLQGAVQVLVRDGYPGRVDLEA